MTDSIPTVAQTSLDLTPAKGEHASVLIIDDEMGLRDVLLYGLKKRGFDVTCASKGEDALDLVRGQVFDLALCDIMMPGMGGVATLAKIKEISPTTEVIMATGFATLETAIESMKNGAYDYITKPFNIQNVCILLDKALEHRRLKAKVNHLEELNRLKSEFMAVVSHELRTPMACTMGFTSLVLEGVYGPLDPRQVDPLRRAMASSETLLKLINNVLDFSKLSANRMTLIEETFDSREVAQEVVEAMEPLCGKNKLLLTLEAEPQLWVRTDRTKLKEILINLLANAVKFTSVGGARLKLKAAAESGRVEIAVSDTGIGIKPESLPLLFQDFQQVDCSTTRKYGGTGLGLCISKKIVELMGGTIGVESKVGQGTTVHLSLPILVASPQGLSDATPKSVEPIAGDEKKPAQRIVLSIDDDPMVLKLLEDSLIDSDLRFIGAQSGEEGLALARQLHPSVITLDIMMPHMDGWSVLQTLKRDPELKDISVLIVSIVDNKPLAFSLGVCDYLLKPFTREDLLAKLRAVPAPRKRLALVVGDDANSQKKIAIALESEGYGVKTADSGAEAIREMRHEKPDVVFLDLAMPEMSGFEVLEAIDQDPMPDAHIIVMSDRTLTADQMKFLERRVRGVLTKDSLDSMHLLQRINECLAGARKAA